MWLKVFSKLDCFLKIEFVKLKFQPKIEFLKLDLDLMWKKKKNWNSSLVNQFHYYYFHVRCKSILGWNSSFINSIFKKQSYLLNTFSRIRFSEFFFWKNAVEQILPMQGRCRKFVKNIVVYNWTWVLETWGISILPCWRNKGGDLYKTKVHSCINVSKQDISQERVFWRLLIPQTVHTRGRAFLLPNKFWR